MNNPAAPPADAEAPPLPRADNAPQVIPAAGAELQELLGALCADAVDACRASNSSFFPVRDSLLTFSSQWKFGAGTRLRAQ